MSDTKEIRTMRAMAWERAKGELYSMSQTFWDGTSSPQSNYAIFKNKVDSFIACIEEEELQIK